MHSIAKKHNIGIQKPRFIYAPGKQYFMVVMLMCFFSDQFIYLYLFSRCSVLAKTLFIPRPHLLSPLTLLLKQPSRHDVLLRLVGFGVICQPQRKQLPLWPSKKRKLLLFNCRGLELRAVGSLRHLDPEPGAHTLQANSLLTRITPHPVISSGLG